MTKDKAFWLVYGDKGCTKFNFKSKNKKKDESDNLGKENNSRNKKEKKENKENKEEKQKARYVKIAIVYPMYFILTYVDETYGYFFLGGTDIGNCFQFKD